MAAERPMAVKSAYNFQKRISAWQSMQEWNAKRKAMAQEFQANAANTSAVFQSVVSNQISGMAEITGQRALDRIKAAAVAKVEANAAAAGVDPLAGVDTTA
jgi:hypothetical protein